MARIERKVLQHERFGAAVLLPKSVWKATPAPGAGIAVLVNGRRCRVRVESERCNCRGDHPHEHRFLALPARTGVRPGDRVTIEL